MQLSKLIANLRHQLNTQKPRFDLRSNPCMTVDVQPEDKALVAFLINLASGKMEGNYSTIETSVKYAGPFDYRLEDAPDKVTLVFDYKSLRNQNTLQLQLEKLFSAMIKLIEMLSTGWIHIEGLNRSENPNVAGTWYAFFLEQLALNLGFHVEETQVISEDLFLSDTLFFNALPSNTLKFTPWVPDSRWNLSSKIIAEGNPALIQQFIITLSDALQEINALDKKVLDQEIRTAMSGDSIVLNVANHHVKRGEKFIAIANSKGTFFWESTEQNPRSGDFSEVLGEILRNVSD